MSLSNPNDRGTRNPAARWFEWNGETGTVRYYDKDAKQNVDIGTDFTFILLDQLATVRGWHDASRSGIYANEVKDVAQDVLIVRAFKVPGVMAEGRYKAIKDRIATLGGQFVANCYIAFKTPNGLELGAIRFKGAALGPWIEFTKAHRDDLLKQAVRIKGFTEGKKGRVVYRIPQFSLQPIHQDTLKQAVGLDMQLQAYLAEYLKRPKHDQAEHVATSAPTQEPPPDEMDSDDWGTPAGAPEPVGAAITDDDIPF